MLIIRYLIIAGLAYLIDFFGFILLLRMGVSPVFANVLVKVVAAVFGFFAHRYFTYLIYDTNDIKKHAVRYFGLAIFYTPISSLVLFLLMYFIQSPIYAKLISDITLFVFMFWITSKFAFIKGDSMSDATKSPSQNLTTGDGR